MKKLSLSIVTVLVFFVATAMAQTTPATDPQGTTPPAATPSNQTSTPEAQTPAAQPATPAAGTQSASPAETKGEKKLKGCIESENGKFVLEAKHGKEITLTGQDVSAHVGHQVVVHGSFQNSMAASASGETPGAAASAGSTSTSSTGTTAGSTDTKAKAGQEFNVTSIDMVASTCKDKEKGEKHEHDKSSTQPPQ